MDQLNQNQKVILEYLNSLESWQSPSMIAQSCGKEYWQSSWASANLKKLVENGMVQRNGRGHYRASVNIKTKYWQG